MGNCKISTKKKKKKKEKKTLYGTSKNISVRNKSTPTNSSPALLSGTSSLNNMNTTQQMEIIVVAKQTFDDDQTLSISWINITKTNIK